MPTSATICCASTSSGAGRGLIASSSPRRMLSSSAAHSTRSSRDSGNSRPFGSRPSPWPERPTRCSSAAITRGEPSWHTRSTSPMSMPSSSEDVATSALSSPALSRSSARSRCSFARLPWCDVTASSPSRSARWRAARSASRRVFTNTSVVRCCADQLREPVVLLDPDLVRHDRLERRLRQLELEVALAHVAFVDDGAARVRRAREERGQRVDRLRRRRDADARRRRRAQRLEPLERQREMRAALVARDRVNFVDDHRAHRAQHLAAGLRREQDVERLGRRDEDVRRRAAHPRALALRRVAGAHGRADRRVAEHAAPRTRGRCRRAARAGSSRCRSTAP